MHRLTKTIRVFFTFGLALAATSCGGKKDASAPSSTKASAGDEREGALDDTADGGADVEKRDVCVGFEITDLEDLLVKRECEVPDVKPESIDNTDMKGKLEVALAASPTTAAPGGKVDLVVTFANKTTASIPLHFRIDPLARFETETYDAKMKRVDMPSSAPPPPPKGHEPPPAAEVKVAKVTLAANGSARVRVPWEAMKMKWAPDKVRGTPVERGYPRAAAGPLPKGKYTVKVVTPLVGVFEGLDREVSAPSVVIEVDR